MNEQINLGKNSLQKLARNGAVNQDTINLWTKSGLIDDDGAAPIIAQDVPIDPIVVPQEQLQINAPPQPIVQPIVQQTTPSMNQFQNEIKQAAFAGEKAAQEQVAFANNYEKVQQDNVNKQQEKIDVISEKVEAGLNEAQAKLDKIANSEIDPNRVFSNNSIGKNIGLAILTGISGDRGLNVLDRMIKQDIAAQMDLKNSKIDAAKASTTMYKELFDMYKDKTSANIALQGMMYQSAQVKLKALDSRTSSAEMKGKFAALNAEIEGKKQDLGIKLQEQLSKNASTQNLNIDPIYVKIQNLPIAEGQRSQLFEAKEVQDATIAAFTLIDTIFDEAKGIGLVSGNVPYSDAAARVGANNANIESAIRATMKGQGTIQEAEIERLVNPLLPLPSDSESRIEIKKMKLKQLLTTKNAGQIGRLKNFGLIPKDFTPKNITPN